jgi:hypothetical protein
VSVQILSHPFRLAPRGAVAVVEQDSDQGHAEQLAVLCLTRIGERPLVPGFGITDPTFAGIDPTEIVAGLAEHGPAVTLTDVQAQFEDDSTQLVRIDFE